MHAANVEVGEVGTIGFVQVVVAFERSDAGFKDDGAEEGGWAGRGGSSATFGSP